VADDIDIRVNVEGAGTGADALDRAAASTRGVETAAEDLTPKVQTLTGRIADWADGLYEIDAAERTAMRQQRAFVHNIGEMGQSVTAVTTMIGQLAAATGTHTGSMVGRAASLVGSMASGAAQGAALGQALGPVGAGLGAVIGGLTPAITALGEGVDTVNISFANLEANAHAAHVRLTEIEETAPEVERALAAIAAHLADVDGFTPDWATPAPNAGLNRILRNVEAANERPTGRRRETPFAGAAMTEDALAEYSDLVSPEEMERRAAADAEYAAEAARLAQETIERLAEEGEALEELATLKADLREEELEAEREKQDYLRGLEENAAQERETQLGTLMSMVGRSTKAMFTAIGQVATGAKSGEEAFLGLLKSFLEMISEYASLKAATEFADAAASFARYDYGGGAAHIAAGVLFTGVAVATGIGAGAIGSGAPAAPARPSTRGAEDASSGGSVTYVMNWNSPVVTAGTRAELGREIESLRSEAEAA
jgi:hypothetical protein